MSKKEDVKLFYNSQAKKRNTTRQKDWPEYEIILNEINKIKSENIKILDLWCWNAYILDYLNKKSTIHNKNIEYTWVDISKNLIDYAKEKWGKFVVSDMIDFLENENQEKYDLVIMIASFQHIPNNKERLIILKNIYRILKYKWKLISINWCFSNWFIKKYKKSIIIWIINSIFSFWFKKYNDILIPWKDENWKIYKRYYHIFWEKEKIKLSKQSWFCINNIKYLDKNWNEVDNLKWRNSIFILNKDVLINNN